MRPLLLVLSLLAMLLPATAESQQPWFFAVLSDPQFGMYTDNGEFSQETANFEFAIATRARLIDRFTAALGIVDPKRAMAQP